MKVKIPRQNQVAQEGSQQNSGSSTRSKNYLERLQRDISQESNSYQMMSLPQINLTGKHYLQQSISQLKKHRVLPEKDRLHKSNSSNLTLKPQQPKTPQTLVRIRQPTLASPLAQALRHEIEIRREESLKRSQQIQLVEQSLEKFQTVQSNGRKFRQSKQPQFRLIKKNPKNSRLLQPEVIPQENQNQSRYNLVTKSHSNRPTSFVSPRSSSSSQHKLSESDSEHKCQCQCSSSKKDQNCSYANKKPKGKVRFLKRAKATPTTRFQTVVTDQDVPRSSRQDFQVLRYSARDFQTLDNQPNTQARSSSVLNTLCCMGNKAQKYSEEQNSDSNCQLQ